MLARWERSDVRAWHEVSLSSRLHFFLSILFCVRRCRFTHDVAAYLAAKPSDIHFPSISTTTLQAHPPFIAPRTSDIPSSFLVPGSEQEIAGIDPTTTCPSFAESGVCSLGLKCRFLGAHVQKDLAGTVTLIIDQDKKSSNSSINTEFNRIGADTLKMVRTRKVSHLIAVYQGSA